MEKREGRRYAKWRFTCLYEFSSRISDSFSRDTTVDCVVLVGKVIIQEDIAHIRQDRHNGPTSLTRRKREIHVEGFERQANNHYGREQRHWPMFGGTVGSSWGASHNVRAIY